MVLKEKQTNGRLGDQRGDQRAGMRVYGRKHRRRRRGGVLLLSVLAILALTGVAAPSDLRRANR